MAMFSPTVNFQTYGRVVLILEKLLAFARISLKLLTELLCRMLGKTYNHQAFAIIFYEKKIGKKTYMTDTKARLSGIIFFPYMGHQHDNAMFHMIS